jgi:hypothetical protein
MPKRRTIRTARKSLRFESLESRELLAQLNFGIPFSLGSGVNTAAIEEGPSTTADELSLVFARNAAVDLPLEILEATRTSIDAPFGNAVSAGTMVNVGGFSNHPFVSPDGLSLLFSKSNGGGIFQATRASRNEPFGSVTSLGDLLPGQPAHQPSLSADELTLFFMAWDTTGVQNDIYQATRASRTAPWGNVVKLGAEINVPGYNDAMPSISSDGLRLFFNSNRPGGFGKFDLYVATRTSVDAPWQQAVNLGEQVNTAHDDKGPSISSNGSLLYFHSDRHGGSSSVDLYEDLYAVTVSYDVPATPTISISDASATEGNDIARLVDVPISASTSPVNQPKSITKGPGGDYFVTSNLTSSVLRYDGTTFQFEGSFVSSGSGGLSNPIDLVFANGDLLVANGSTNSVLRYDGDTGTFLGAFVPSGANGIERPTNLLVHNGDLYISAWSGDVHRYDLQTGLFIDKFISTGSGGLNDPVGIAFGPDGNFYVAEYAPDGNNAVLRYDGSTGSFLGEFVPEGSGGLIRPAGIDFGPDGNLYVVNLEANSVLRYAGDTGQFLGTFVASGQGGLNQPTRLIFDQNRVLIASQESDLVARFEVSPWAVFNVTLSSPATAPVSVDFSTANGTASASDYVAKSGTITFAPGETSRTILVQTLDDAILENNETFVVNLSNSVGGVIADGQGIGTIIDNDIKFYVVNDATQNRTYEYGPAGEFGESYNLASGNTSPRGAASTATGDRVWVVDANRNAYVYNTGGGLAGSWTARTLPNNATIEGIATNGTDVWIVDARGDRVYRYAGAASRTSGSQFAASSFRLDNSNTSPKDIVTDGTHLWVVNDSSTDRVFKYTIAGALVGSWTIDPANRAPTGITLDPASPQHIWVVDSGTDRVYQYNGAASRTSGSQTAASSFALAPGNTNPQGIADPPSVGELSAATASSVAIEFPSVPTSVPSRNYTPSRRLLHSAIMTAPTSDNLNLLAGSRLAAMRAIVDGERWGSPVASAETAVLDAALEELDYRGWPELLAEL